MTEKGKEEESNQVLNSLFSKLRDSLTEFFPNNEPKLKEMILKTSDQFIFKENKSQWDQMWFQIGYLNYFMPMQYARLNEALIRCIEAYPDLENKVSSVIDFGSGPGLAALVFKKRFKKFPKKWTNIDESKITHEIAQKIYSKLNLKESLEFKKSRKIEKSNKEGELILLSYSLCEGIDEENIFSYDNIFILEPSTKENSRKLLKIREQALKLGYNIVAPCTHCDLCPMLDRKNDWCHDRVKKPKLSFLEKLNLPFSEKSLGFSYLLLSKVIKQEDITLKGQARVIGDFSKEKGKTKVAICQGPNREFLSWLKRSKYTPNFSRGDSIKVPKQTTIKGQEIRILAD